MLEMIPTNRNKENIIRYTAMFDPSLLHDLIESTVVDGGKPKIWLAPKNFVPSAIAIDLFATLIF